MGEFNIRRMALRFQRPGAWEKCQMKKHSAFMWGYEGWGPHTRALVRVVDEIEKSRGMTPPLFVDVRYRRNVRAVGFRGNAFEQLIGRRRYRWIKKLGNENIGSDGRIKIADQSGIIELLQLIIEAEEANQRVIFFCSCPEPCYCHRLHVARLAVRAAHWHGIDLTVSEWPGGAPRAITLPIGHLLVRNALRNATRISLDELQTNKVRELTSLPWYSRVDLVSDKGHAAIMSGPAQLAAAGWYLPSIAPHDCRTTDTLTTLKKRALQRWKADAYASIDCNSLRRT